ncbi:MAG: zinc-binding dehydrogenase [Deferribacterota bacterium]|nr:zinc-binding dehydrogenase [Deferribacterota bacterium]
MKGKMKDLRLYKTNSNIAEALKLEEVDISEIGPKDVLLDVKATGLCGSDIHMIDGSTVLPRYPITLGHETAGIICEVGEDVKDWSVGDRVCVNFIQTCGKCLPCKLGRPSICINKKRIGMEEDGAYAEYVKVPAETLIKLPDNVPFDQAAICTDAVATPFHAISKRSNMRPGDSVAIFGLGGLGVHAVELSKMCGAGFVIGVDVDDYICERAKKMFGADYTINAREKEPVAEIIKTTGCGVDISMEIIGLPKTQEQAINSLRPGGRALIIGLGAEPVKLPSVAIFARQEFDVVGCYAFENLEIERIIKLVSMGRLDLSKSVTSHIKLEEIGKGLDDLHHKKGYPIRIVAV